MAEVKMLKSNSKYNLYIFYIVSISLGVFSGITDYVFFNELADAIATVFIKLFKFISLPLISLSLIVSLSKCKPEEGMLRVWGKTVYYTIFTTMMAASVALVMYKIINPINMIQAPSAPTQLNFSGNGYLKYITNFIPQNFITPFLESHVISVLMICIAISIAMHFIDNPSMKETIMDFFGGMHKIFLTITNWIMKIIPIALGSFVAITILQLKKGLNVSGLGEYLMVIISANLVQGIIILPIFLLVNGLNPYKIVKGMFPALLMAFLSKSSSGTLPVTMRTAEKNLNVTPRISQSIFPFCTSINMNGCAAFLFITIVYVMQNNGIIMSIPQMFLWVIISSIAAAGNAGIPMGCFFLGASLLTNMGVPIHLMRLILPFYTLVDRVETTLNVWSDSCVTVIIDKQYSGAFSKNLQIEQHIDSSKN